MSELPDADPFAEYPCPRCGSETYSRGECQTWVGANGVRMSCMPCDNAVRFMCVNDETCSWEYVFGSERPGDKDNPGREKPDWLDARLRDEYYPPPEED